MSSHNLRALPEGSQLLSAVIILRHGARTPKKRFNTEEVWPFDCSPGQLTAAGWQQAFIMGKLLWHHFLSSKQIADELSKDKRLPMRVHTTEASRCIQTAKAILLGFLDKSMASPFSCDRKCFKSVDTLCNTAARAHSRVFDKDNGFFGLQEPFIFLTPGLPDNAKSDSPSTTASSSKASSPLHRTPLIPMCKRHDSVGSLLTNANLLVSAVKFTQKNCAELSAEAMRYLHVIPFCHPESAMLKTKCLPIKSLKMQTLENSKEYKEMTLTYAALASEVQRLTGWSSTLGLKLMNKFDSASGCFQHHSLQLLNGVSDSMLNDIKRGAIALKRLQYAQSDVGWRSGGAMLLSIIKKFDKSICLHYLKKDSHADEFLEKSEGKLLPQVDVIAKDSCNYEQIMELRNIDQEDLSMKMDNNSKPYLRHPAGLSHVSPQESRENSSSAFYNRNAEKEVSFFPFLDVHVTHQSALMDLQAALGIPYDHLYVPQFASSIFAELFYVPDSLQNNQEIFENARMGCCCFAQALAFNRSFHSETDNSFSCPLDTGTKDFSSSVFNCSVNLNEPLVEQIASPVKRERRVNRPPSFDNKTENSDLSDYSSNESNSSNATADPMVDNTLQKKGCSNKNMSNCCHSAIFQGLSTNHINSHETMSFQPLVERRTDEGITRKLSTPTKSSPNFLLSLPKDNIFHAVPSEKLYFIKNSQPDGSTGAKMAVSTENEIERLSSAQNSFPNSNSCHYFVRWTIDGHCPLYLPAFVSRETSSFADNVLPSAPCELKNETVFATENRNCYTSSDESTLRDSARISENGLPRVHTTATSTQFNSAYAPQEAHSHFFNKGIYAGSNIVSLLSLKAHVESMINSFGTPDVPS